MEQLTKGKEKVGGFILADNISDPKFSECLILENKVSQ